jgi:hypothetical protein
MRGHGPLIAACCKRMYADGVGLCAIARRFSMSHVTVRGYVRGESKGLVGHRPRKLSYLEQYVCWRIYSNREASSKELAEVYDVSGSAMRRYLLEAKRESARCSGIGAGNDAISQQAEPSTDAAAQLKRSA